ncbi:hypothetical protein ABBQ38_004101 [Trebouxia sp. C0009 RCD-2024]
MLLARVWLQSVDGIRPGLHDSCLGIGNGLIQLLDYKRDEFEWRYQGSAGGILSLALQPEAQYVSLMSLLSEADLLQAHCVIL